MTHFPGYGPGTVTCSNSDCGAPVQPEQDGGGGEQWHALCGACNTETIGTPDDLGFNPDDVNDAYHHGN